MDISELAKILILIVGFIGNIATVLRYGKKSIKKAVAGEFVEIHEKLDRLTQDLNNAKFENAKIYLIHFLSRVDAGEIPNNEELYCYYEKLDYYREMGGNGYVASWVERLERAGKLEKKNYQSKNR